MKKSIIVLLVLAILAGIGLTSCKNEVQAPVDELVSISFGYDSSRALTASLQTFDVGNYYWFYESEKADGSGLKSGQTGAGLTDLSSENAMATVLGNALPANCVDNVPEKGLENPVEGFSKGLWNFRLFAVTVENKDIVENEVVVGYQTVFHPVYIGEARNVLIDNEHHTVKVVVSPFSADYQIGEEYGYLEIGNIQFKEASSQSSVTAGALTITDKVSSYNSSTEKWEEVSRAPVNGKFTLLGGTYLYERIYSLGVSEITRGSVVVTVYPNLTTTVSGFVTELTTSFKFETTENPDVVNVSAEATIAYNDTTYTSDTYTLTVEGQAKVEAEITKDAADDLIEELTDYFALTDSSIADIDLNSTSTSMDLNLGVRTTATTAESVAYDINMTAVVTYGAGKSAAKEMTADVKTVPDYVMVTVNMQSGVSVTSVTHSGKIMTAVSDIDKAGTSQSTEVGAGEETADDDGIYVGFYKYDSVYNKLYIKTRSFSPFVVNYKYVESDSMAKVIRYVANKADTTELSHASITSAEVEILDLMSELKKIMKVLPAMDFSINPDLDLESDYQAGAYNDILKAIQTGTFVTFMPKFDAAGKTADELPESDAYYSGGKINTIEGWNDYLNTKFSGWRTDFRVITNDDFNNGDFYLVGHYVIGNVVLGPVPITNISDLVGDGYMDVMKQLGGDNIVVPYDLLLGLCSTEDGVRHGFNCGAYAVSSNAYGKKITVQLILTNDNLIKEGEEPETVVCAEVVCEFHAPDAVQDELMESMLNQLDDSKQLLIHKDSDGTDCSNDIYMSLADFRDSVNRTGKYYDENDSTKFSGYTYSGYTVTLQCDIDLNKEPWTPIGSKDGKKAFSGTFNGAGHVISKLYYNDTGTTSEYIGFFGQVENALIENLIVSGEITAYQSAGGVVARAVGNTTIQNVTNRVNVTAGDKAGGIICAAYPNITASGEGITDRGCTISVIDCMNSGKITCSGLIRDLSNPFAGGIIANTNNCGKVICEGCVNAAMVIALDEQGDAVTAGGKPNRGYIVGVSTATVKYPNPADVDASFKAGVYLFNCINTYSDLSYAAIGSANGIGLYKIYVKDSEHDEYAKLSDTAGAVYYDGNKFYN